jgi:hypothetical protein
MTDLTLLLLLIAHLFQFSAGDYLVDELRDENASTLPPFSISRIVPFDGGLRLFLRTDRPDAVSRLLAASTLEAQLSDHKSETAKPAPLSLGKAICVVMMAVRYSWITGPCHRCAVGRRLQGSSTSSRWRSS